MTVHCHSQRITFFCYASLREREQHLVSSKCFAPVSRCGRVADWRGETEKRSIRLADGGLCMSTEQDQNGGGEHESD